MPKTQYIVDLALGTKVSDNFVLTAQKVNKQTKKNVDLNRINGVISDRTGIFPFVMFDVDDTRAELMKTGVIVKVQGDVTMSTFIGRTEVKISSLAEADADVTDSDLLYSSAPPLADMRRELFTLVRGIQDVSLKLFLTDEFFSTSATFMPLFQDAPAGSSNHHAYRHGLIQHTLEVTRTAKALAQSSSNFPAPNLDIVIAGALLHDVGKVDEFDMEGMEISRTTRGDLLGHIVLGLLRVENAIKSFNFGSKGSEGQLTPDQAAHLLHIVASHHGKTEYGSPVEPMTMEAEIVHTADALSVNQQEMSELNKNFVSGQRAAFFSNKRKKWLFARPLEQ